MSKYNAQSMAKIKCREVEAASVRSKEAAKVKYCTFLRTEGWAVPAALTERSTLPGRLPLEAGPEAFQQH